jgi:tetratricopeptide (TPR) repeat protein
MALENLGRFKEAVVILDRLIKKHPKDPLYLIERGHCALKMGYPLDALRFYRQAMSIWRHSGQFQEGVALYSGLCTAYTDLRIEALEVAIEGLKELPAHPTPYYNAGRAYCGMGLSEEAMEILKKGLETFPEAQDLRELLKEIEEDMDSPEGGIRPSIFTLIFLALLIRRKLKGK